LFEQFFRFARIKPFQKGIDIIPGDQFEILIRQIRRPGVIFMAPVGLYVFVEYLTRFDKIHRLKDRLKPKLLFAATFQTIILDGKGFEIIFKHFTGQIPNGVGRVSVQFPGLPGLFVFVPLLQYSVGAQFDLFEIFDRFFAFGIDDNTNMNAGNDRGFGKYFVHEIARLKDGRVGSERPIGTVIDETRQ
jgi:hypothetical protein